MAKDDLGESCHNRDKDDCLCPSIALKLNPKVQINEIHACVFNMSVVT